MPEQYVAAYKESYNKASNRLVREFSNLFCKDDGGIDWEKLVEFNSGTDLWLEEDPVKIVLGTVICSWGETTDAGWDSKLKRSL